MRGICLGLALGGIFGVAWLFKMVFPAVAKWWPQCLLTEAVGKECPACGVTGATLALGAGDWRGAWEANAGWCLVLVGLAWVAERRVRIGSERG